MQENEKLVVALILLVIFYLSCGQYEEFKHPGHTLNGVLYQVESSSDSENDKSLSENSILKDSIQPLDAKCESCKRKLPLSSSFKVISIRSKT